MLGVHLLLLCFALLLFIKLPCPNATHQFHDELKAFHYRIDQNLTGQYVYFIGDSHLQGLAVQEIDLPAVNYGMGSDTTEGVLARLPLYQSLSNARAIVLGIGFNDLRRMEDREVLTNLVKILETMPANIPILYSLLLPIDESKARVTIDNQRIDQFNSLVESKLSGFETLHLINVTEKLKNKQGGLKEEFHIGDGIHLNRLGNAIYIDEIKQALRRLE